MVIEGQGGEDIEYCGLLDPIGMIEGETVRNTSAAVVARDSEAREAECLHDLHLVACHDTERIVRMVRVADGM